MLISLNKNKLIVRNFIKKIFREPVEQNVTSWTSCFDSFAVNFVALLTFKWKGNLWK